MVSRNAHVPVHLPNYCVSHLKYVPVVKMFGICDPKRRLLSVSRLFFFFKSKEGEGT